MASDHSKWRVSARCINCLASRTMAPEIITERGGQSVFVRQPGSEAELLAAWRALEVCPTAAVEAPNDLERPKNLFPEDLGQDTYRLGFNARSSYGAHSYFIVVGAERFMIDAPRWSAYLISWITNMGGLDHILLTHRDDVADARRYAEHFSSRVWIHEGDARGAPFATDVMRGAFPQGPSAAIQVISVPGHTCGSVMYLANDHTLFTGDSLAWDAEAEALRAFEEVCWYDWPMQLRSLAKLRDLTFSRMLAGHGGSVDMPSTQMQIQLEGLLSG